MSRARQIPYVAACHVTKFNSQNVCLRGRQDALGEGVSKLQVQAKKSQSMSRAADVMSNIHVTSQPQATYASSPSC